MDISKQARELDIDPGMLETALDGAAGVLRASRENVRPADKKALRGVAKTLAQTIDRLSGDAVRERLVEAVFQEPDGPDEDGLAHYTAWCAAQARVDRTIEGARDLSPWCAPRRSSRSQRGGRDMTIGRSRSVRSSNSGPTTLGAR